MIFLLLLALSVAPPYDSAAALAALLDTSSSLAQAHIGYKVVDLQTGRILAAQHSGELFVPASNTKLFTGAMALEQLGPDWTWTTELRTSDSWTPGQTSIGDLQLVGGGDPNLSSRVLPYDANTLDADPLTPARELAAAMAACGITRITGDVLGISTRYRNQPYPEGWAVDDTLYGYGAPVTALSFNDNIISLFARPAEMGEPAYLRLSPSIPHLIILNELYTSPPGATDLHVSRPHDGNELVLWGTIGIDAGEVHADLAVDDGPLFAAEALIAALAEKGIAVDGSPRSVECDPSVIPSASTSCMDAAATLLATRRSAPLSQVLQVMNKVSQNQHAEMLLREVQRSTGSESVRQDFLTKTHLQFNGDDGSGLARSDSTTPDSVVALLTHMWDSAYRDVWLRSLPIGGHDGTLQHRFKGIAGAERIHAKTGSLEHVSTLSGYAQGQSGKWFAFSAMVDGTTAPSSDARRFLDELCGVLLLQ